MLNTRWPCWQQIISPFRRKRPDRNLTAPCGMQGTVDSAVALLGRSTPQNQREVKALSKVAMGWYTIRLCASLYIYVCAHSMIFLVNKRDILGFKRSLKSFGHLHFVIAPSVTVRARCTQSCNFPGGSVCSFSLGRMDGCSYTPRVLSSTWASSRHSG